MTILDPTAEAEPTGRPLARKRLRDGEPATIGFLDISKPRGDIFLDELDRLLRDRGLTVVRAMKPTFTKTAPADLRAEIAARCDAVVVALAD